MSGPLAIDLFCGLGGWTEGLLSEGWRVRGYDIEAHEYGDERYPAELVLADVMTLNGADLADADLIVASPPCTEFSYMAMPWGRAKQIARALRGEDDFPTGYKGSRTIADLTALFDACFRIQREASEAAGRHIPMVVENVKGAQPWVGRAQWAFGSFFLWGDIPALMPVKKYHEWLKVKAGEQWNVNRPNFTGTRGWDDAPEEGFKSRGLNWSNPDIKGQDFTRIAGHQAEISEGRKNAGGSWFNIGSPGQKVTGQNPAHQIAREMSEGHKHRDLDGYERTHPNAFGWKVPRTTSKSAASKAASAKIAKIPLALSTHIARVYLPDSGRRAA